jgi:hypothetical protein
MDQDKHLPPEPTIGRELLNHNAQSLPQFDSDMSEIGKRLNHRFGAHLFGVEWTTGRVVMIIFIGSFILGVLFTSAVLAGLIEIHPSAIKSFLKSLVGKG